jgi:hypothetical protein
MRPKPHEIELAGLQEWYASEEVTYASSNRESKRLVCTLNGTFKVKVAGETVWQGMQLYGAVEAYNAVTEKYVMPNLDFTL